MSADPDDLSSDSDGPLDEVDARIVAAAVAAVPDTVGCVIPCPMDKSYVVKRMSQSNGAIYYKPANSHVIGGPKPTGGGGVKQRPNSKLIL